MALLLHLSDLHLGTVRDEDIPDDFKSDIVPLADRVSRQKILKESLAELAKYLRSSDEHLDALIISGDITVANDEAGFQMLDEILESLGDRCPKPEKTVVVPGNHDVKWEVTGDPAVRYDHFVKHVRAKGFITPLLEGIDVKAGKIITTDLSKHYLLDPQGNWAVIPLNSSHLCGSVEPLSTISEATWRGLANEIVSKKPTLRKDDVTKELRHLRLRDVARISPDQIIAIKELASVVREKAGADKRVLLTAVLHHHLLPVSVREEFKPFESITNLGLFRSVLRDNNYSAVFHGHKHTDYYYFDYIHRLPQADVDSPHRVFVVSAPSSKVPGSKPEVICRLIRVDREQTAPTLSLQDVPSVEIGTTMRLSPAKAFSLWQSPLVDSQLSPFYLVEGMTVDEVYNRGLALFDENMSALMPNVVCRVAAAYDPVSVPVGYPSVPDIPDEERPAWFKKIVDWWQKEYFVRLSGQHHFNHGHRIHRYDRKVNQLESAAEAIRRRFKTTRAVITLLDPEIDKPENEASRFPSFSFVQFVVRDRDGQYALDVIAYFRKQEMRYWWPINIAELAQLQNKVLNLVKATIKDKEDKTLMPGVITTIAASAHLGTTVPYILTPPLDFDLEESPHKLWDMTYALCWDGMKDRVNQSTAWERVLKDLIPPKDQDPAGVPVPIQGVEYLADIADHFGRNHEGDVKRVAQLWKEVEKLNKGHSKKMADAKGRLPNEIHRDWRSDVLLKLNEIRAIVNRVFNVELNELK